eukprot:4846290-Pyramimonas_sp.AAC.1
MGRLAYQVRAGAGRVHDRVLRVRQVGTRGVLRLRERYGGAVLLRLRALHPAPPRGGVGGPHRGGLPEAPPPAAVPGCALRLTVTVTVTVTDRALAPSRSIP